MKKNKMFRLILCLMLLTLFVICVVMRSIHYKDHPVHSSRIVTINRIKNLKRDLPWFFKNSAVKVTNRNYREIWQNSLKGDRIVDQLMYFPNVKYAKMKQIYLDGNFNDVHVNINKSCPVNKCRISYFRSKADAVVYRDFLRHERDSKVPPKQIWVLYRTGHPLSALGSYQVNRTATYRPNSDIVIPYGKWVYYDKDLTVWDDKFNYATGKTKKVAALTDCLVRNKGAEYLQELKKYIEIDFYGNCGNYSCPRYGNCLDAIANKYKFYLAFEEINCRDYITEKFFDALRRDIVPVVMGAHPEDYKKVAPLNSYIHVEDFRSPQQLATHLNLLSENDNLYNTYYYWKGTGEFIDSHFFCRLCAMLHTKQSPKVYQNVEKWWNSTSKCTTDSWNTYKSSFYLQ